MKISQLVIATTFLSVVTLSPVLAEEKAPAEVADAIQRMSTGLGQKHVGAPASLRLFIGNVSVALLAIDHEMPDVAASYVEYAQKNIPMIEEEAPGLGVDGRILMGHFDYTTRPHAGEKYRQQRYALIPLDSGVFPVQLPKLEKKTEKKLSLKLQDAKTTFLRVDWKKNNAKADLQEAKQALSDKQYGKAATALQKVIANDIGMDKVDGSDMLQSAYNHVMLADSLLQEKNYAFSRMALKHAREQLKRYAAFEGSAYDEQVRALRTEIEGVSDDLVKEDPSTIDKIEGKIKHWMQTLKKWMTFHRVAKPAQADVSAKQ